MRLNYTHIMCICLYTLSMFANACARSVPRHTTKHTDQFIGAPRKTQPQDAITLPKSKEHREEGSSIVKPSKKRPGILWYKIAHINNRLDVRMRLIGAPQRTSFFLPGSWAGRLDHARAISIKSAAGPRGALKINLHRAKGRIDIEVNMEPWVELHYTVALSTRRGLAQRFKPQHLGKGFFAYAPTFLILPSAQISEHLSDIPIEVHTPSSWTLVSTWPLKHKVPSIQNSDILVRGFLAKSVHELRDAFIAASNELRVVHDDSNLKIAFEHAYQGPKSQLIFAIRKIMNAYIEKFGPVGHSSILVRTPSRKNSAKRMLWGAGKRGGFVVEVHPKTKPDAAMMVLMAHEAFHLWNGHTLIPHPEHEHTTRWFKEGATHYVALRTLRSLGLLKEHLVLSEIASAAARYKRNAKTLGAQGTQLEEVQYPYDRGLLLALFLDNELRAATRDVMGIDDWMRSLLRHARRNPYWLYDVKQLKDAWFKMSNSSDFGQVWRRHITQRQPLNLATRFAHLGLHWLDANRTRPAKLIALHKRPPRFRTILKAP